VYYTDTEYLELYATKATKKHRRPRQRKSIEPRPWPFRLMAAFLPQRRRRGGFSSGPSPKFAPPNRVNSTCFLCP
jgi:hypothetical protein